MVERFARLRMAEDEVAVGAVLRALVVALEFAGDRRESIATAMDSAARAVLFWLEA